MLFRSVVLSSALLSGFVKTDQRDYIGGLAGQISGIINEVKPAAQVLEEMVEETVEIFAKKLPETVVAK
mgnify:FL=1